MLPLNIILLPFTEPIIFTFSPSQIFKISGSVLILRILGGVESEKVLVHSA